MVKKQIEDKSLTVSEIAEKASVSRSLVWAYIRKNHIKPIEKDNNKFRFDSVIVFKIKKKQDEKQKKSSVKRENNTISEDVLKILNEQLKIKDQQIKDQTETIEFLRSEVVQVRLENRKTQKLLEDEQANRKAINENEVKKKKSLGGSIYFDKIKDE